MSDTPRMDARNQLAALEAKTRGRSITETDYFQMRALCQELAEVCDGLHERVQQLERELAAERDEALAEIQLITAPAEATGGVVLEYKRQRDEAIAALREREDFIARIFDLVGWPDGSPTADLDGFDLQDLAVKHGVLTPETVTEPCGEVCQCADWHGDISIGVTCYRKAPWLVESARRLLNQPQQDD